MLQSGRRKFKGCFKSLLRLKHERISTVFRILVIRQQMVTVRKKAVFSTSPKLIQISELKKKQRNINEDVFTSLQFCWVITFQRKRKQHHHVSFPEHHNLGVEGWQHSAALIWWGLFASTEFLYASIVKSKLLEFYEIF